MTQERKKEIVGLIFEWQELFDNLSYKQALFALYDDKMITGEELDELIPLTLI